MKTWTDAENDHIVTDYFRMLEHEMAGRPYSKAEHNRRLQETIGRGRGAIEFKHQNVSAILRALGEPWISGYVPRNNFQGSLVAAVERHLESPLAWFRPPETERPDEDLLPVGVPPHLSNRPPPRDWERVRDWSLKLGAAERDEQNRLLGRAGEKRALAHERATLAEAGRTDLAERVRWVADEDGDGYGYDIRSFLPDGSDRLVEVKTTNGWDRTPFFITPNELDVSRKHRKEWYLLRLWNFARAPQAFELRPPLENHVTLFATGYQARFE